jgi:hypothetical protein
MYLTLPYFSHQALSDLKLLLYSMTGCCPVKLINTLCFRYIYAGSWTVLG